MEPGLSLEKVQDGVFQVCRDGRRIGVVSGGNGTWMAEGVGGPFKSRRAAVFAVDQQATRERVRSGVPKDTR